MVRNIDGLLGRQGRRAWLWRWAVTSCVALTTSVWLLIPVMAGLQEVSDAQKKVEQQLAFGEFAGAVETAQAVADPRERIQLLKQVANAQLSAGDVSASRGTTRRIDQPAERAQAQGQQARRQSMLGGGVQADFTSLINLITSETSGPWQDVQGEGGTITEYAQGVAVNPNGLLSGLKKEEQSGRLKALGLSARKADLNADVAKRSELRLISLTRLEQEVSNRLTEGRPVVDTMKNLAGLTKLRFVLVYPESRDIVIGGTAEAWKYNDHGLPVGVESGRPLMQLDDLVTVLRTFSGDGLQNFGCSFNPRPEGMKQLQAFVEQSQARGPLEAGAAVKNWANQLQSKLGPQDIELWGVPRESRVTRVITEADYKLKMIGIGKLDGGRHIPSIFELLTETEQKAGRIDALRWWLTMKYDSVLHSPERDVFEIQGPSVQCLSENQFLTAQGERVPTGQADATNRAFAENFTKHYAELAQRDLTFADLQNVFDLALVSALLKNEGVANRIGWDLGSFAANGIFQPAVYAAPQEVESVANHRVYRGRDIVVQVAGGVRGDVMSVVKDQKVMKSSDSLTPMSARGQATDLPAGRWWWDAK